MSRGEHGEIEDAFGIVGTEPDDGVLLQGKIKARALGLCIACIGLINPEREGNRRITPVLLKQLHFRVFLKGDVVQVGEDRHRLLAKNSLIGDGIVPPDGDGEGVRSIRGDSCAKGQNCAVVSCVVDLRRLLQKGGKL